MVLIKIIIVPAWIAFMIAWSSDVEKKRYEQRNSTYHEGYFHNETYEEHENLMKERIP